MPGRHKSGAPWGGSALLPVYEMTAQPVRAKDMHAVIKTLNQAKSGLIVT